MREHNAVCDMLAAAYPSWSDDEVFDKARLVIAALIAKIHTVEWTTAILNRPALRIGDAGQLVRPRRGARPPALSAG